jgi:uncharacterized membrane protein YhaH (DUF805 family)
MVGCLPKPEPSQEREDRTMTDPDILSEKDRLFWLFFRFSGRLSRSAYFLAALLLSIVVAFPFYRFMLVYNDILVDDLPWEGQLWALAFWFVFLVSLWSSVALGAKRMHDFDWPGPMALITVVPGFSIVAFVALCILAGNPGPNRYGQRTNAPAGG